MHIFRAIDGPIAAGVFKQIANQAAHQLHHPAHLERLHACLNLQHRTHAGTLFCTQAHQVHCFNGAQIGFLRIQATGQQYLVDQLIKLSNVARDFLFGDVAAIGTQELQAHADACQRRAKFMRGIGQQRFL